jgi:hypothetical protein
MGACSNKDKHKIKTTTIVPAQQPKQNLVVKEITNPVAQLVPRSGAGQEIQLIKETRIEKEPMKRPKIRFISDQITIHEALYPEDTNISTILKDPSEKMKAFLTDSYLEYPNDFDIYIITSRKNQDQLNPIRERIDITSRPTDRIKSLLPMSVYDNSSEITIEFVKSGLEISRDIRLALIQGTQIMGAPKFESDPFEIIIYEKSNNNLIYYLIQDPTYDFVKAFTNFSAYCNGFNRLFISGGAISDEEFLPTFVEIDLAKISNPSHIRKLPNLIHPRSWHSMIFVPPRYVFIVGGSNTKAVEVYNIETGEIKHDSNLNESRSEPSLCVVNNSYLYAFCGFLLMQNYNNTFEKCNLRKKNRIWELVSLKFDTNFIFEPSFFTVAYEKGNNIVLLGGHEQKGKSARNYIFKQIGNEHIIDNYSINEMEDSFVCSEKFFTPLDENVSVLIPSYMSDTVKILHFNSEMGLLYQMKFEAIVEQPRDDRIGVSRNTVDKERKVIYENFPGGAYDNNI